MKCQCENVAHESSCPVPASEVWLTIYGRFEVCRSCNEEHRPPADMMEPAGPSLTFEKDKRPTLEEAQKIVGGYVTMVHLPDGGQLLCDEDGEMKDLPVNEEACDHLDTTVAGWKRLFRDGVVRGNVLILSGAARWD